MAVVALGCCIERLQRGGQYAVLVMVGCCLLLNLGGVLPKSAPVYGFINQFLIPLAIPLLLFDADLARIWRESGRMLLAFAAAVTATVAGCWLALQLSQMHPQEAVWAGIVSAGFIGSAANTMAVALALERSADTFFPLLLAGVYMVTVPFVVLLLSLPAIPRLWRCYSPKVSLPAGTVSPAPALPPLRPAAFGLSMMFALALGAGIVVLSGYLAELSGHTAVKYLAITLTSVALATALPGRMRALNAAKPLGSALLYLFFALVGVQVDFSQDLGAVLPIMQFAALLLLLHIVLMAMLGRLLGIAGPEMLVASLACLLGPPAAAAMSNAQRWHSLLTPGILVGVLGYAIANVIGVAIAHLF